MEPERSIGENKAGSCGGSDFSGLVGSDLSEPPDSQIPRDSDISGLSGEEHVVEPSDAGPSNENLQCNTAETVQTEQPCNTAETVQTEQPRRMKTTYRGIPFVAECDLQDDDFFEDLEVDECYYRQNMSSFDQSECGRKQTLTAERQQPQSSSCSPSTNQDQPDACDFNPRRFMEYLNYQSRQDEAQYLDAAHKGNSIPSKEHFSDDDILKEMKLEYGDMNVTTERFKRLFKNYKISFLEEVEEYAGKAKLVEGKIKKKQIEINPTSNLCAQVGKEIRKVFTAKECELYGDLNPWTNNSQADWFDIPRPKDKWAEHFKDKLRFEKTLPPETKAALRNCSWTLDERNKESAPRANLAVFDLKYEDFPKHVSHKDSKGTPSDYPQLSKTLSTLISAFPNGIDEVSFLKYFKKTQNYDLLELETDTATARLNENSSEEDIPICPLFLSMEDVFLRMNPLPGSKGKFILFPAAFKSQIGSRLEIETKLVHFILISFVKHGEGFVRVDDIPHLLEGYCGVRFNYRHWGYNHLIEFMDKLEIFTTRKDLQLISFMHKTVRTDPAPVRRESYIQHYLVSKWNGGLEKFEIYRKQHEDEEVSAIWRQLQPKPTLRIPQKFMEVEEELHHYADKVFKGFVTSATCFSCVSPSKFDIVLTSELNTLEEFQQFIQDRKYTEPLEDMTKFMRLGLLVMAHVTYHFNKDIQYTDDKEWFRGQIIKVVNRDNGKYKIRLLDFGVEVFESIENLRLLPRAVADQLSTMAIRCRLKFEDQCLEDKSRKNLWTTKEKEIFFKLLNRMVSVVVNFESREYVPWPVLEPEPVAQTASEKSKTAKPSKSSSWLHMPTEDRILRPEHDAQRWVISATLKTLDQSHNLVNNLERTYTKLLRKLSDEPGNSKDDSVVELKDDSDTDYCFGCITTGVDISLKFGDCSKLT